MLCPFSKHLSAFQRPSDRPALSSSLPSSLTNGYLVASGHGLQETPRQLIACLNGNPLGIAISKFKGDKIVSIQCASPLQVRLGSRQNRQFLLERLLVTVTEIIAVDTEPLETTGIGRNAFE